MIRHSQVVCVLVPKPPLLVLGQYKSFRARVGGESAVFGERVFFLLSLPECWGPFQHSYDKGDWIREVCVGPFLPALPEYPHQLTCLVVDKDMECGNEVRHQWH